MRPEEYHLLEDIMYEAIYHPDKKNPYPKDVIYLPQVKIYWDNWGKGKNDHCLIASINGKIGGAVWIRAFCEEIKGCGYIDPTTPEIAIALFEEYRNRGIGTRLMEEMINFMETNHFKQVSLSVSKGNPAINLYLRLGFRVVDENADDYIMLLKLE